MIKISNRSAGEMRKEIRDKFKYEDDFEYEYEVYEVYNFEYKREGYKVCDFERYDGKNDNYQYSNECEGPFSSVDITNIHGLDLIDLSSYTVYARGSR